MPLKLAEQRTCTEQQDAHAVDLRKGPVEVLLDPGGSRPVGLGWFGAQGEKQVEVGYAEDGGAARDAAVDVGAVQPTTVERFGYPSACRVDYTGEGGRYPAQCTLARNPALDVQSSSGHGDTLPEPPVLPLGPGAPARCRWGR
ncbi:hypothetical protein [Micromonospora zamorensis]|uniref:hypothetical protein n=1 Tax=Micromonospora zamorensis TaxID=709883 RepID=UPI002ED12E09|nr:hypothetical protein OG886_30400 [Micromonospora zamorensis]